MGLVTNTVGGSTDRKRTGRPQDVDPLEWALTQLDEALQENERLQAHCTDLARRNTELEEHFAHVQGTPYRVDL